jgi:hypothetical protein
MSSAAIEPAPVRPKCTSRRGKRLIYGLVEYDRLLELGAEGPGFELSWLMSPDHEWRKSD